MMAEIDPTASPIENQLVPTFYGKPYIQVTGGGSGFSLWVPYGGEWLLVGGGAAVSGFKQEMHEIIPEDVAAGYFELAENPSNVESV